MTPSPPAVQREGAAGTHASAVPLGQGGVPLACRARSLDTVRILWRAWLCLMPCSSWHVRRPVSWQSESVADGCTLHTVRNSHMMYILDVLQFWYVQQCTAVVTIGQVTSEIHWLHNRFDARNYTQQ